MTTLTNSFEGGTDETTITPANSGGASGDAFGDALNAVFDTARAAHGSVSCRWSVAAASTAQTSWLTAGTTWFARAYVYMTAAPPANMQLLTPMDSLTIRLMVRVMTNRTVQITSSGFGNLGQSATVLPLNTWCRVEAQFIEGTTTAGLCTVRIYTSDPDATTADETVVASSTTIGAFERIRYGANFSGSQTYSLWGDDLAASDVDWLGPATLDADLNVTDSASVTDTVAALAADTSGTDSGTVTDTATQAVLGEPEYTFAIDWNNDGTFTGTGEDITERVLASGGFTTTFGRDQVRSLSPPAAGRAAFSVDNTSGDYSPDRTDSPLADDVLPARPFEAVVDLNGEVHTLFRGHLDEYTVKVERNDYTVDATALDGLADLKDVIVSTQLHAGIRTGTAIGYLLDAADWPADARDLDPGATHMAWWWLHNEDAWEALLKLLRSEGPGAIVHADEDGKIVFRDRHHRLLNTASTTGQALLTDGADGYEPAFSTLAYDHGWDEIVNTVRFSVEERAAAVLPETVWESADVRSVTAAGTVTVEIETNDPVVNPAVTYTTRTGTVTETLTQVTAQSLTLEFTAGGTAAAVSDVVVVAQPVTVQRTYTIAHQDAASVTKYGARSQGSSVDAPWAGVHDAEAIAQLIIGARAERLPVVTITVKGVRNVDRLTQQISRNLSDRVHLMETVTGVDADFFLDKISHRVLPGGFLETEFGLEKAPTQPVDVFIFDDPDHGFDDGVFGSVGLDNPEHLFIFDDAAHGFDDGVFAT